MRTSLNFCSLNQCSEFHSKVSCGETELSLDLSGAIAKVPLRNARVLLHFLLRLFYCSFQLSFESVTTSRYFAESVSKMGVPWMKYWEEIGSVLFVILSFRHFPGWNSIFH